MDEIWERAVETALDGQTDHASVRSLTLDGAVKCVHGRLPHQSVFERFPNLQHLSLANIGVSSLEQFPRLVNLQKLVLSDNRIAGGLECLVEVGLGSLVDIDLSNNRIQFIEDLVPLAELRLVSLVLYECPVTRVKDYRARVFGLIKSLKYLDKMDAEENETPESDEEDEEEDEEEEDDRGSGEEDGGERPTRTENGHGSVAADGILDSDDDDDAGEEQEENEIVANGEYVQYEANGYRMVRADEVGDDENVDEIEEEDNSSGEEINEEDADEDEIVEVHEVVDSDDEDDGVEYEEDEEDDSDDDDDDDDEEEVDNKEQGTRFVSIAGRFASAEGEIDGHEHGEDDADDDNGETGEEDEQGMEEEVGGFEEDAEEEDEDDDEENGSGYLVQPVNQHSIADDANADELSGGSDMEHVNDIEDEEDDMENNHQVPQFPLLPSSSSLHSKRNRSDDDADGEDSGEEDDTVHQAKLPKKDP